MGEFLDFFLDFLWFSLVCISATQSLAFPSPRDRKVYDTSRRRHISCVRPIGLIELNVAPHGVVIYLSAPR